MLSHYLSPLALTFAAFRLGLAVAFAAAGCWLWKKPRPAAAFGVLLAAHLVAAFAYLAPLERPYAYSRATDRAFNEFQVIMCRNVMIYFNKELQARVHALFLESLVRLGYLCLGSKESLKYLPQENDYEEFDSEQRIYRKVF